MAPKIKIRRGTQAQLPTLELAEFGFTTDNKELYIGNGVGNTHFPSETYVNTLIAAGGGGELLSNLASLNTLNTTSYALTTSWVNVVFPTIIFQNQTDVIELDAVNTDRILIKQSGTYFIYYCSTITVQTGGANIATTYSRFITNDSTAIPNSEHSVRTYVSETHNSINTLTADLIAGDYISLQVMRGSESTITISESRVNIIRLTGVKGDKGDTGSGSSINVYSNNAAVVGTPHTTLDFSDSFSLTNIDGERVVIDTPAKFIEEASSDSFSSTTSNAFQTKVTTTLNLVSGKYKVGWYYEWGHGSNSQSFRGRVTINGTDISGHYQEVKDNAAAQWQTEGGFYYYTGSGNTIINLDYCSSTTGQTARIQRARLEIWRVV